MAAQGAQSERQGALVEAQSGSEELPDAVLRAGKEGGAHRTAGRVLLSLEFLPPSRRRRDDDNLLAAFKAGRDGLADALRIDDSVFVSQVQLSTEVHPLGAVRVTLSSYGQQGAC